MVDVVVGDDHTIFVDALLGVLPQQGFAVLGTANSVRETVQRIKQFRPDVCLLDRFFPDGDGIDVISELISVSHNTRVLMLTSDTDALAMRRALKLGAHGYLNKGCTLSTLTTAIDGVARGETVVNLADDATTQRAPKPRSARLLATRLTGRERECLGLLVAGERTATMARSMGVSPTTVRTHVQSLLTKLGVHSRLEAASFALRHGLLDDTQVPESSPGA